MSSKKAQALRTLSTLKEATAVKIALQFLFPLSIFFFPLICYSSCFQYLFQSINRSYTTSLLDDLNHIINRKAMFMFCNAILLFLARDFDSRCSSVPVNEHYDEFVVRQGEHHCSKTDSNELEAQVAEEKTLEENVDSLELAVVEQREEGEGMELVTADEDLAVEEFNRKIEEFIKKVKRERMLEALQLVNV